jgi:hypothetical protein
MWIISFLPDFIFHLIVIAGILGVVASFVCGFIPFVSNYKLPIQVASIIALVFGIYFEGGIANEEKWQARVKELEAKIAIAESQSRESNTKLQSVVKEKTQMVKQVQLVIQDRIVKETSKMDAECKVSSEVISILNDAAQPTGGAK